MLKINEKNEEKLKNCVKKLEKMAESMREEGVMNYSFSILTVIQTLEEVLDPEKRRE